jgi:SOS-response transcriptional repressor LexA
MPEITPAQRRVYDAVLRFEGENSRAPLLQEVADALGMRSKSNICVRLQHLERAGWIKRDYRHVMTIRPDDN